MTNATKMFYFFYKWFSGWLSVQNKVRPTSNLYVKNIVTTVSEKNKSLLISELRYFGTKIQFLWSGRSSVSKVLASHSEGPRFDTSGQQF